MHYLQVTCFPKDFRLQVVFFVIKLLSLSFSQTKLIYQSLNFPELQLFNQVIRMWIVIYVLYDDSQLLYT